MGHGDGRVGCRHKDVGSPDILGYMERIDGSGLAMRTLRRRRYASARSLAVLVELYHTCNNRIIEHNASAPLSVVYDSH